MHDTTCVPIIRIPLLEAHLHNQLGLGLGLVIHIPLLEVAHLPGLPELPEMTTFELGLGLWLGLGLGLGLGLWLCIEVVTLRFPSETTSDPTPFPFRKRIVTPLFTASTKAS